MHNNQPQLLIQHIWLLQLSCTPLPVSSTNTFPPFLFLDNGTKTHLIIPDSLFFLFCLIVANSPVQELLEDDEEGDDEYDLPRSPPKHSRSRQFIYFHAAACDFKLTVQI